MVTEFNHTKPPVISEVVAIVSPLLIKQFLNKKCLILEEALRYQ